MADIKVNDNLFQFLSTGTFKLTSTAIIEAATGHLTLTPGSGSDVQCSTGLLVGDTSTTNEGTIRYNSGNFEGYTSGGWTALDVSGASSFVGLSDTPSGYTTANAIYTTNGTPDAMIETTVALTEDTNTFNIAKGTASLDIAAGATLDVNASLTVESTSVVNQDLSSDASPTFTGVTVSRIDAPTGSDLDLYTDSSSYDFLVHANTEFYGDIRTNNYIYARGGSPDPWSNFYDIGGLMLNNTDQSVPCITLNVGANARYMMFCESADDDYNFSHSNPTDPTFYFHSKGQVTDEWVGVYHDQTNARITTGSGAFCIGTGTPGNLSLSSGEIYSTLAAEFDGIVYADAGINSGSRIQLPDNNSIRGTDWTTGGGIIFINTYQSTANCTYWGVGTTSRNIVIADTGDYQYNYAHAASSNPSVYIHSASGASTSQWLGLYHDGAYATLTSGSSLKLSSAASNGIFLEPGSGGGITMKASVKIDQDLTIYSGSATTGALIMSTSTQTTDSMTIAVGATPGFLLIRKAGVAGDYEHTSQTNPTIYLHSGAQSTTQYLGLLHNQTNAVIASGAGHISLTPASGSDVQCSTGLLVGTTATTNQGTIRYDSGVFQGYTASGWSTFSASTGDVAGPAGATDGNIASFDGATGKLLQDSGVGITSTSIDFTAAATITTGSSNNINLTPNGTGYIDASTAGAYSIYAANTNTSAKTIYGKGSATGAYTVYGGYFESASNTGIGVYAEATNVTPIVDGRNYGVWGVANAVYGIGVRGEVSGIGDLSNQPIGVYGLASSSDANSYGIGGYFYSYGAHGIGCLGSGPSVGVSGGTTSGKAILGEASSSGYSGYFDGGSFTVVADEDCDITLNSSGTGEIKTNTDITSTASATFNISSASNQNLRFDGTGTGNINMFNNGNQTFQLLTSGIHKFYYPSAISVYETSGQDIVTGTYTTVLFNNEVFDIQGEIDTSVSTKDGLFVATENGYYVASAGLAFVGTAAWAAGDSIRVQLSKNGATAADGSVWRSIVECQYGWTGVMSAEVSAVVYLAAADTLEVQVWHDRGSNTALNGTGRANFFTVIKVA